MRGFFVSTLAFGLMILGGIGCGDDTTTTSLSCGDYAETVCTKTCDCESNCRIYYPSASSQSFGSKSTCTTAMGEYCSTHQLDMTACGTDLTTAACTTGDFGLGFDLPDSCY